MGRYKGLGRWLKQAKMTANRCCEFIRIGRLLSIVHGEGKDGLAGASGTGSLVILEFERMPESSAGNSSCLCVLQEPSTEFHLLLFAPLVVVLLEHLRRDVRPVADDVLGRPVAEVLRDRTAPNPVGERLEGQSFAVE